jgi:hypothetical protein
MGAFYGNITLKGPSQQQVLEALRGRRAIVAPRLDDYTVAFDSVCDDQDIDGIQALASRISSQLRCSAFAVIVSDDDVLGSFLYHAGQLTDWYNSCPSYFDFGSAKRPAGPAGGDAGKLCAAFGVDAQQEVESILRKQHGKGGYAFESNRHKDLVRTLGLPLFTVGTALANFDRGEFPDGLSAPQMLRAIDPPPLEDSRRKVDRKFYDQLGPEDLTRPCKHNGCGKGSVRFSVFCKHHHFEMIKHYDCPFDQ